MSRLPLASAEYKKAYRAVKQAFVDAANRREHALGMKAGAAWTMLGIGQPYLQGARMLLGGGLWEAALPLVRAMVEAGAHLQFIAGAPDPAAFAEVFIRSDVRMREKLGEALLGPLSTWPTEHVAAAADIAQAKREYLRKREAIMPDVLAWANIRKMSNTANWNGLRIDDTFRCAGLERFYDLWFVSGCAFVHPGSFTTRWVNAGEFAPTSGTDAAEAADEWKQRSAAGLIVGVYTQLEAAARLTGEPGRFTEPHMDALLLELEGNAPISSYGISAGMVTPAPEER